MFGFKYAQRNRTLVTVSSQMIERIIDWTLWMIEQTLVAVNSQMIEHIWTNDWLNSLTDLLLILISLTGWLYSYQPDDGLWYRPKYRIIEVRNKWSRFSLKLELFQQLNTNIIKQLNSYSLEPLNLSIHLNTLNP